MADQEKTILFEQAPIPKAFFTLAIPTILASLVSVLYNLADTYFVGILNDPIQNAAVTLAAPVMLAFNAVNNLFGVGSSSMMSRALGRKDIDAVYRSSAFGFYCSLICGILFSLLVAGFLSPLLTLLGADADTTVATGEYVRYTVCMGAVPSILNVVIAYMIRAEGSALHASIGTMSGCLLNIVLDPFFILPQFLNMGAAGAGLATLLSNCFALLYFFVLMFVKRGRTYVCMNPAMFRCGKSIIFGVFAVGIPACIQNLLNVTGMTILNNFTADYSANAVAAMGIAQKINMIPTYIALGIGQAVMPLIGYNFASRNTKRMKEMLVFTVKLSSAFMLLVTLCYYIFAGNLVRLFMKNPEIVAYGSAFLRGLCLGMLFMCIDFLAVGVFQACGMGGKSLVFAILRKIVFEIPALFLLNDLFPLYGLAYAQAITEFVLAIAAVVVLVRIFRQMESATPENT